MIRYRMMREWMELGDLVKVVVFVPLTHADQVREAMGKAGAGKIGNYSRCSFSTRGVGRFFPGDGSQPHLGEVGRVESVEEERIETICPKNLVNDVVRAVKAVHPYEEVALDLYPLLIC